MKKTDNRDAQLRDLDQILESFKEKVRSNWNDKTFKRAFKSFKNNFRKTIQNDNTLIRVMFDFSNESRPNVLAGRKRKIGFNINTQTTARPRQKYPSVGRNIAGY